MNLPAIPKSFFNGDCFDAYRILGAETPLRRPMTISVHAFVPDDMQSRTVLATRTAKGRIACIGGRYADGAVTATRVASAVQGDWLLVTLSAECLEQIGETVPILTD